MVTRSRMLVVRGGWDGHDPVGCTDTVLEPFADQFRIEIADTFDAYSSTADLLGYDLIVQCWSMGALSAEQEQALVGAVRAGVGFAGWHGGIIGTCVANPRYLQMVGGRFVWHPDGFVRYRVRVAEPDHPIMAGIGDYDVTTEQYWLLSDATNRVLADCVFQPDAESAWDEPVTMPVIWLRRWGKGRVFVCALGHNVADLQVPQTATMIRRGLSWASRT